MARVKLNQSDGQQNQHRVFSNGVTTDGLEIRCSLQLSYGRCLMKAFLAG